MSGLDKITWALGLGAHCYGCYAPTLGDYAILVLAAGLVFVAAMGVIERIRHPSLRKTDLTIPSGSGSPLWYVLIGAIAVVFVWLIGTYGNPLGG